MWPRQPKPKQTGGFSFSPDPSVPRLTLEACQSLEADWLERAEAEAVKLSDAEAEYLQNSVKSPSVSDTRVLNFPVSSNGLLEAFAVANITKSSNTLDRYTSVLATGTSPFDAAVQAVDAYAEHAVAKAQAQALREWRNDPEARPLTCHRPVFVRGRCKAHNIEHVLLVRCKRRTCPQCGAWIARTRAREIETGIETFQRQGFRVAHFVGTFAEDVTAEALNRTVEYFLRRVRRYLKSRVGRRVEYVRVDEQTKAGRYHTHILLAPWSFIPQDMLSKWWRKYGGGPVVFVRALGEDAADMSEYLTKLDDQTIRTPSQAHSIAEYLSGCDKDAVSFNEQTKGYEIITQAGKRSIAFSRGWPRLEAFKEAPSTPRKGEIEWSTYHGEEEYGIAVHYIPNGHLIPIYESNSTTEYVWVREQAHARKYDCRCFEFVGSDFCSFSPAERVGGGVYDERSESP